MTPNGAYKFSTDGGAMTPFVAGAGDGARFENGQQLQFGGGGDQLRRDQRSRDGSADAEGSGQHHVD